MIMEASNELKVKYEPIYKSQSINRKASNKPNRITKNEQSIKDESQFIQISHSKRKREDISRDNQPNKFIRQPKLEKKVKEEPKDGEIQTSKSQIEFTSEEEEIKEEEKFSAREEFANKISIASLNEETTNQAPTSNNEPNNPTNKKSK